MELVTLKKSDPRFKDFLLGKLADGKLALPIESLNIQSLNEQVTYRIIEAGKIQVPPLVKKWSEILRLQNLILVLVPAFLLLSLNLEVATSLSAGIMACLGVICLHLAGNLRNDFLDHVEGFDRIHPLSGSRAIQNGWIRAFEVKNLSNALLLLGCCLGVPALIHQPMLFLLVAVAGTIGLSAAYSYKFGLRFRKFTELAVFCLLGPLLSIGLDLSFGSELKPQALGVGLLMGWLAVFYLHSKNFAQLFVNSKTQMNNSLVRLGFEKGKYFLLMWWMFFLIGFGMYHWIFSDLAWCLALVSVSVLVSLPYFLSVQSLKSPVGSQLLRTQKIATAMINFISITWLVQSLWSYWIQ